MSSNIIYLPITPTVLMIKRHQKTGLKYFHKTTRIDQAREYLGSGTRWTQHIKKHGKEFVETLWVSDVFTDSSISRFALKFSRLNKIVESNKWANLVEENGLSGGDTFSGKKHSIETIDKMKVSANRKPRSEETKQKIRETKAKNPQKGKKGPEKTKEWRENLSKSLKGKPAWNSGKSGYNLSKFPTKTCPHCDFTGAGGSMTRFHFDNCKLRP